MFKFFYIFFIAIFIFSVHLQECLALQTFSIDDNQTKNVTISMQELSRIFVKGDRIINVRGVEGAYILTKDAVQGQVFIKPTSPYQSRPFNLFISTEQGRNYNLYITAVNRPGQDIELQPRTPSKNAVNWEKASDYAQALVKLIVHMIKDEAPDGYGVVIPNKKIKATKYTDFTIRLAKQYRGNKIYGEVLLLENRRNYPIHVYEKFFYQDTVRAITVLNTIVPAKGHTTIFRVCSEAGNE